MKSAKFVTPGGVGISLSPAQKRSLALLLEGTIPRRAFLWNFPLNTQSIKLSNLSIITECCGLIKVEDLVKQESVIEDPELIAFEEELLMNEAHNNHEEEDLYEQIMEGPRRISVDQEIERMSVVVADDIVDDPDVGKMFDIEPPVALNNEEILELFQREYCAQVENCSESHFFIAEGAFILKDKKYAGLHIFPSERSVQNLDELFTRFTKVFDATILAKAKADEKRRN